MRLARVGLSAVGNMPAKWKRCVRKVRLSLKRRRRKGNPYAICSHLRGKGHAYATPSGYWEWEARVAARLGGRKYRHVPRSELHAMYRAGITSSEAAARIAA